MDLVFETPPEPKRMISKESKYAPWLRELRNHPDRWVRYPEPTVSSIANSIKKGALGAEKGKYQAVVRNTKNGKGDLYVRYIG